MTLPFFRIFITVEPSAVPPIVCHVRASGSEAQDAPLAIVRCTSLDALEQALQTLGASGYSRYVAERDSGPVFENVPRTVGQIVAQLGGLREATLTAIAANTGVVDMRQRVAALRESSTTELQVEPA